MDFSRLGIGNHHSASRFLIFQVRAATIPEMKRALEQIRRMRGGAQSHLMRCADEHHYVVKFQNNPQHPRVLVNEMLGARLAQRLGLPTTPVEITDVSEDLIRLTAELCMEMPRQRIPCRPGPQFGSGTREIRIT
jgi:hypothetical protein